jgi:hypothetical protein
MRTTCPQRSLSKRSPVESGAASSGGYRWNGLLKLFLNHRHGQFTWVSRADAAKVNEALAKLVCHNLCCVIMSQCEWGIEPVFWKNEPEEAGPAVLPFVR